MTQEEEIDLAMWQGQSVAFLPHWLELAKTWDRIRQYSQARGDGQHAEGAAAIRDRYLANIENYVAAMRFGYETQGGPGKGARSGTPGV